MFRKAEQKDLDAIEGIYNAIIDEEEAGRTKIGWVRNLYPTREVAEKGLHDRELFVEEIDGTVVASGIVNHEQGEVYSRCHWIHAADTNEVMVLHTLAVHPKYSGRGYGSAFLAFYEQYAKERGCRVLRIDTNKTNTTARSLYRKCGFTETEMIPFHYESAVNITIVLLEKRIEENR